MAKTQPISIDDLDAPTRDTHAAREIKENDGTAKIDGRSLRKTGRSKQVMWRTTPAYQQEVMKLAEAHGWTVGQTLERAVDALKREMKKGTK
jgi:hypothetical protein